MSFLQTCKHYLNNEGLVECGNNMLFDINKKQYFLCIKNFRKKIVEEVLNEIEKKEIKYAVLITESQKKMKIIHDKVTIINVIVLKKPLSSFDALVKYINENDGSYPTINDNPKLYQHIRESVLAYFDGDFNDSPDIIQKYESLPNWIWDYSRLGNLGIKALSIFKKIKEKILLTSEEVAYHRKLKKMKDNKNLSAYLSYIFVDI